MELPGRSLRGDFLRCVIPAVISQWLRRDCPEDVETLAAFLSRHVPQGG